MKSLKLLLRFVMVGGLVLLLLIPLLMINSKVKERARYRQQAVELVSQSTAGPQSLLGPIRVVPFKQVRQVKGKDADGNPEIRSETETGYLQQSPKTLDVGGQIVPETRKMGLYSVPVFTWKAGLKASFDAYQVPLVAGREYGEPYLVIGVADARGLRGLPVLTSNGKPLKLESGTRELSERMKGLHADLSQLREMQWEQAQADASGLSSAQRRSGQLLASSLQMDFVLAGTQSLSVATIGDSNHIALSSAWQHPNFTGGRFLPNSPPKVDGSGFSAQWDVSSLASDAQSQLASGNPQEAIDSIMVSLIDPVDVYTMADRASKYGILFVVLTFVGFALFELIKRLPIHPLQYLLVGLALAIFFLLLLSLSEHIRFLHAYLVSAAACIGLQFVYLSGVLKSWARAAGFATLLTALYGVLYGLLISEDNALLMGSLMLFGILAAIMWVTRKVDWYDLGTQLR